MGTLRTTDGEKRPDTPAERRKKIAKALGIIVVVLGALAATGVYVEVPQWVPASGVAISPEYAEIRAGINGKVRELRVASNAHVGAGDVLLWIDIAEAKLTHPVAAPFAGRVVGYSLYMGKLVTPSTLLYEIFSGEVQGVKLHVPERHAVKVRWGAPVRVEFGTHKTLFPTVFEGEITELRQVIESDGTRNYQVAFARFDPDGRDILPGASAEARILVGRIPLWRYVLQP
ncbi:MAG: HlyD family efflux transporter periplasmic adaptor subunit [Kiritimatiellaeota bacterium]|nr:HlyD family efflux transporter periplasmic adaptor subunit [Kiritimatiellota bacterium]